VTKTWRSLAALLLAFSLFAAACGDDSGDDGDDVEAADEGSETTDTTEGGSTDTTEGGEEASCDPLPLKEEGTLTVATGEPAFPPWVGDDDDPTSGEGFESALVYEIAGQLGIADEDVVWVRTGFDEAIAAGETDYDFNIQQYSITPQRDEVVDFSDGYYTVQQALVAAEDSSVAEATSIADLQDDQLGAAVGTTSLNYIDDVIQPDSEASVFDDNAAAKAAFDAGQVDGLVFDLPTAYYITAVEIPNSSIVGVLPATGDAEELGMLFEDGSPLVPCVNEALAALQEDGTLEALQEEWLQAGGDIPTLTE
jgi:polar amino acid transport system substrate-binding protein